ncbi:DNA-binding transcriptional LysR family regulator [Rhizobium binae]|uniref:DNA-binding transcriptional LysR family regulator n=1 Tax=Rhizobium binae TaxID=1138190 RepID=A0ABV2M937_9HYPH|nr:LysR family transcriptional regulator [Rhizobium binae]MBX4969313.1 LysR family transcriptional regulator [Rhizobium binae]MBX4991847.1 LysR family transcriptional regulator [Rhizobium binae]NKL50019.1 LysR family transcriptional regulator [Rhizobium leguminosarum bv. viciae]QSY81156.1 LysR family transcriptional regulator [Rhizobium binae]
MPPDPFTGLTEFLAVADARSFTAAAASLGVTPTAVSQTIRALEKRLGVPLFVRTTRRVALTEAGAALFHRIRPAAADIADAFDMLGGFRDRPLGHLRLTVPRMAVPLIVTPLLPRFRQAYPDISVEISVDDATIDITERGFDAGIRIGEAIEKDMIAMRLTSDITWTVVGSPDYFARHGRPATPEDLTHHQAIRYRYPTSGAVYRWEFERDGRDFAVDPPGGLIVNDFLLLLELAEDGLGLVYLPDISVAKAVASGQLERVLEAFLPTTPGLFAYFPARSQTQPKLRAFLDMASTLLRPKG